LSGSESVVRAVASRNWSSGAEAKLLSAVLRAPLVTETHPWREWYLVREAQLAAEPKLQAAGLTVSCEILEGDPKRTLLEEAERWEADSVFVGATGLHRVAQLLLGSVPAALCAQANCSVEVVRASFTGATDDFV
jgi:nucleotide-binding universal stress UspA family protein